MQLIAKSPSLRHARVAAALMLTTSFVAAAAPLAIVNPGFEDLNGEVVFNEFTFGPLNGWGLYDPASITHGGAGNTFFIGTLTPFEPDPSGAPGVYTNIPDGAPQGQRVGIAFNFSNSGGFGEYGFQQTLSATLAANTRYTLAVDVINIASGTSSAGTFFNLTGFPGYRVDLLAGGAVIAQDVNALSGTLADGAFGTSTVVFTTDANPLGFGQNLAIRLVNLNVADSVALGADLEVDFDNVRLDAAPVPVPTMLPMLAVACAALGLRRRKRSAVGANSFAH